MPIIECVPNISEGRRPEVIEALARAVRTTSGVRLLDVSSDVSHNRSVFTLVGTAAPLKAAVLALAEHAIGAIDLRSHAGEHPRIGAVDVVPFIPIDDVTMDDCVELARDTASAIASRFDVPVFLYEEAATSLARMNLEDIRRGQFEGLAAKMSAPEWVPDFGPRQPHPTAGATVVGARMPLIAFNVNLDTDRLDVARAIAAAVRHSSGGFRYVKALGVPLQDRGIVQVSMNLTNHEKTPIHRVFAAVVSEASRYGVTVLDSEIVGLIPAGALLSVAEHSLQLQHFSVDQVLETRLREEEPVEKWKRGNADK
jgi:glutamate formiminotransferase